MQGTSGVNKLRLVKVFLGSLALLVVLGQTEAQSSQTDVFTGTIDLTMSKPNIYTAKLDVIFTLVPGVQGGQYYDMTGTVTLTSSLTIPSELGDSVCTISPASFPIDTGIGTTELQIYDSPAGKYELHFLSGTPRLTGNCTDYSEKPPKQKIIDPISVPIAFLGGCTQIGTFTVKNINLIEDEYTSTCPNLPYTVKAKWRLVGGTGPKKKPKSVEETCSQAGCDIAVQNQSVGESVSIVGSPFFLRYQSDRVQDRADANSLAVSHAGGLGGWTLNVHHVYDPGGGGLFLGDGRWRSAKNMGTVKQATTTVPGFSTGDFIIPAEDGSEVYIFDQTGRHLRTLHPLTGAVLYQFTYDPGNLLTAITDGTGNMTTINRDGSGNPKGIVGPYGQTTSFKLDANDYLASITNPAKESWKFVYTQGGLLTKLTRPRGNASQFSYDSVGQLIQDTDPTDGLSTLSSTDTSNGWSVDFTTPMERTTNYWVENLPTGQEKRINTFPSGLKTEFTRDSSGILTSRFPDGTQASTTLSPDPRWALVAPLSSNQTISTPGGLVSAVISGRTANLADPNNPFSLTTQTDTVSINGQVYTSAYNGANRTFNDTTPAGRQVTTTVDALGRPAHVQVAGLAPVDFVYDARGRLIGLTEGTGSEARTTGFSYNSSGYLESIVDPLGLSVGFSYNPAGRPTKKTLPDGRVIGYKYDANDNLTGITTPGRSSHAFTYNSNDLVSEYAPPKVGNAAKTLHAYNADKQLTEVTHPDGQTVDYNYDSAGRLSTLILPDGQYSYAYGATTGILATATAPGGNVLSYSYDGSLPVSTSWAGEISGTVSYTYDKNFRITSEKINGGDTVLFQYDADGLLTQAGTLTLSRSSQNGLIVGNALGGIADSRSYNSFAELVEYSAAYNNTPFYVVHYTRDQLGRITGTTETIGGSTNTYGFTYDLAGRLTAVQKNGTTGSSYTYDSNDNRLTHTGSGSPIKGKYDKQDRLVSYGQTKYTYSANGELLSKTSSKKTTNYKYDLLGNLLSVSLPDGTEIEYIVDAENRRIGKKVNGARVQGFLYQGGLRPVAELDGGNNVVSRFVYATRVNVPDYMVRSGITYRIITDHLGSPRLVVNTATGDIVQRIDYDEFGIVTNDTNPGFQPFGFAGGLYDPDTDLVRFGVRDYDAEPGRWTAKDPILFDGGQANLYAYVGNDPVNAKDAEGLGKPKMFDIPQPKKPKPKPKPEPPPPPPAPDPCPPDAGVPQRPPQPKPAPELKQYKDPKKRDFGDLDPSERARNVESGMKQFFGN